MNQICSKHKACPECGNTSLIITCAGPVDYLNRDFEDNVNNAKCGMGNIQGCGWRGPVKDLVEPK